MKRTLIALVLVVTLAGIGGTQDADRFVTLLADALSRAGWSEEEAGALAASARSLDWSVAGQADPEVVAHALAYARQRRSGEIDSDAEASLALEVARVAVAMRDAGFDRIDVAVAAAEGAREAVRNLAAIAGERTRDRVAEAARMAMVESVRSLVRADATAIGRTRGRGALRKVEEMLATDGGPPFGPRVPGGGAND